MQSSLDSLSTTTTPRGWLRTEWNFEDHNARRRNSVMSPEGNLMRSSGRNIRIVVLLRQISGMSSCCRFLDGLGLLPGWWSNHSQSRTWRFFLKKRPTTSNENYKYLIHNVRRFGDIYFKTGTYKNWNTNLNVVGFEYLINKKQTCFFFSVCKTFHTI